jgi:hypothetical protein
MNRTAAPNLLIDSSHAKTRPNRRRHRRETKPRGPILENLTTVGWQTLAPASFATAGLALAVRVHHHAGSKP